MLFLQVWVRLFLFTRRHHRLHSGPRTCCPPLPSRSRSCRQPGLEGCSKGRADTTEAGYKGILATKRRLLPHWTLTGNVVHSARQNRLEHDQHFKVGATPNASDAQSHSPSHGSGNAIEMLIAPCTTSNWAHLCLHRSHSGSSLPAGRFAPLRLRRMPSFISILSRRGCRWRRRHRNGGRYIRAGRL